MLRALSRGQLTVHGKRRACSSAIPACSIHRSVLHAARRLASTGTGHTSHKERRVQVQDSDAPSDSYVAESPSKTADLPLPDARSIQGATGSGEGQANADHVSNSSTAMKFPKYVLRRSVEKRMHARAYILASHAHNRPTSKSFKRFAMLMEPHLRERGEKSGASEAAKAPSKDDPHPSLAGHFKTLRVSKDVDELWEAYEQIIHTAPPSPSHSSSFTTTKTTTMAPSSDLPSPPPSHTIPLRDLRRLARVLASTHPRTRPLFLRLLSVLSALSSRGDTIQLWAWNALIDCAGKGWRRTGIAEYKTALSVYNDMTTGGQWRGVSELTALLDVNERTKIEIGGGENVRDPVEPDIITLTTLLDIALETRSQAAIRHATSLLEKSGLRPTEITHLVRLKDSRHYRGLVVIRDICRRLELDGHSMLSIGGLNAFLWTISRDGRWDILLEIYRILQKNTTGDLNGENDREESEIVEGIPIHRSLIPNSITYTTLIQSFAYHGQLASALDIFRDMLLHAEASGDPTLNPSLAILRALFCAFARHTKIKTRSRAASRLRSGPSKEWTEENLDSLLEVFLELPKDRKPSDRTVYWIISSYIHLCGKDSPKVSEVYMRLSGLLDGRLSGRMQYLNELYGSTDPEEPSQ